VIEGDARAWLVETCAVSRETIEKLEAFKAMVIAENSRQNLISVASIDSFWVRHIVDSAQLWCYAPNSPEHKARWLDLGTGAGFPGIVLALLSDTPITMVESRRRRADFLSESVERLGLAHAKIEGRALESVETSTFSVITARAFAPLPKLFELAHRFSTEKTCWILPKGRSAREEVESVRPTWHGVFHVKQSVTDAEAAVLVGSAVRPKRVK
jgi:16S rRNA (guanine527-N7)-methyltransferase